MAIESNRKTRHQSWVSNYDFMSIRQWAGCISISLVLISGASLALKQLNFGLDFTGGTLIEVGYSSPADLPLIRSTLDSLGHEGAQAVFFGSETDVLIRVPADQDEKVADPIIAGLREQSGDIDLRRVEFVGPQVGAELREQGGLAMLAALGLVLIYVAFRFQLKFAVAAVVALLHDVLLTLGLFSLTGLEFNLTVLAAILAVIGYSLNDTIVVSDRIRENFRSSNFTDPIQTINYSLNQTLSRTLVTSLTTLLVLFALLLAGGELIRNFALALTFGVAIGTYSSVYIASNVLLLLKINREELVSKTDGH